MTIAAILNQIRRLVLRLAPAPVCDGCIARQLNLTASDEFRSCIGELAAERDCRRERDACALCKVQSPVLRKLT
jgi:hypothetical protein